MLAFTFANDGAAGSTLGSCPLQAHHEQLFFPALPPEKVAAIQKLGFGVVDKIFLHFTPQEDAHAAPTAFGQQEAREQHPPPDSQAGLHAQATHARDQHKTEQAPPAPAAALGHSLAQRQLPSSPAAPLQPRQPQQAHLASADAISEPSNDRAQRYAHLVPGAQPGPDEIFSWCMLHHVNQRELQPLPPRAAAAANGQEAATGLHAPARASSGDDWPGLEGPGAKAAATNLQAAPSTEGSAVPDRVSGSGGAALKGPGDKGAPQGNVVQAATGTAPSTQAGSAELPTWARGFYTLVNFARPPARKIKKELAATRALSGRPPCERELAPPGPHRSAKAATLHWTPMASRLHACCCPCQASLL